MTSPLQSADTICALSTAAGGAIAVIRVSGKDAITITDKLFSSAKGKSLAERESHKAIFGQFKNSDGECIDDVVVVTFKAPHSYTGEDTTEISCHGSRFIIGQILKALVEQGCRQAGPGEYTQRAFLNGKLDLSQAEAVADLIASTNRATHKMAMSQLRGHFSNQLSDLRDKLLHLTSLMELELDFSDHDVEFADRAQLLTLVEKAKKQIDTLSSTFATGKALREGVAVAIVGKTNVGKSTLLNRLLHDEKAIVSDIHGTTRDVIEDTTQINGVTFRFIDTAGIRETSDTIEQMGIERTMQKLDEASIVLWMTDTAPDPSEAQEIATRCKDKSLIAIVNKIDKTNATYDPTISLKPEYRESIPVIAISARNGIGIEQLEKSLYESASLPEITENDVIVTNIRHYEALQKAHADLQLVEEGMKNNLSGDLLSEDLRACIEHLSEIVGGAITPDETLGNIFKNFCVGK